MPGWHKQTKKLVEAGGISVAGIVQEQHPDRAALYMQWQKMDWPVLADPYNDLGISAVPITLLIDEHGIIRYRNPRANELQKFLTTDYPNDSKKQPVKLLPKDINALDRIIGVEPKNASANFRLGVAYRLRFDSDQRADNDFSKAMKYWEQALALHPNQYIWRRRIQQYGPRLDKPYAFYDWINKARADITKRGEKPLSLLAEPSGAEFAVPSRGVRGSDKLEQKHPDLQGKVARDTKTLVSNRTVIVASTNSKKSAVRVYLTLQPVLGTTWTNDAGALSFHLAPDSAVQIQDVKIPQLPEVDSSAENRVIEFEVHPKAGEKLPESFNVSAFYYVCTKSDNVCQFLRKDIEIVLK